MKELEILGLITMVYDYEPNFAGHEITSSNPLPLIVQQVISFLTRKKYFTKEGEPTEKLYNLLESYDVHTKQLEDIEENVEEN